jgi:prolyl-tRNA synthetase
MRASRLFMPTLRQETREAEPSSDKLLVRGGFMRQVSSNFYLYLPLGYRVLHKIANIIREEMKNAGGQELLLPTIQPSEFFGSSCLSDENANHLKRYKYNKNADLCLSSTNEELVAYFVGRELNSYRQLPLRLYHIQPRFRSDRTPQGRNMRMRGFLAKGMYSFDRDEAGLNESYKQMSEAYYRVFQRCGLETILVDAGEGDNGNLCTQGFVVAAESGEDVFLLCEKCGYVAHREYAQHSVSKIDRLVAEQLPLTKVNAPGVKTVQETIALLGISPQQLVKTLMYVADGDKLVAVVIRGDHQLNEIKLRKVLKCKHLAMATAETVQKAVSTGLGFLGPVGLENIELIIDNDVQQMANFVAGANENDAHLININIGRDFHFDRVATLRFTEPGDSCPYCQNRLKTIHGIEVGQISKLGTKYTEAMQTTFLDRKGRKQIAIMGSYHINISDIMSAIAERHHDQTGIIWPVAVAPYIAAILLLSDKNKTLIQIAETIYHDLSGKGYDVLFDDRSERAGVKFNDADLVGIPIHIVIGESAEAGEVEIRLRRNKAKICAKIEEVSAKIGWMAALASNGKGLGEAKR